MKFLIDMAVLGLCGALLGFYIHSQRDRIVRSYINRQPRENRHAIDIIETLVVAAILIAARHLGT